jgi:hypothetical protein
MARLLAAALPWLAATAHAETYRLELTGQAEHWPYCYWEGLADCTPGAPIFYDWKGLVAITLDASADGTFTGTDLTSFTLTSNAGDFSFDQAQLVGTTVTLANQRVVAIDADLPTDLADGDFAELAITGLDVSYSDNGTHHYGWSLFMGTLAPVPEPVGASLMLGGLAMLSTLASQRRRERVSRRRESNGVEG